jgi:hypothetical protein
VIQSMGKTEEDPVGTHQGPFLAANPVLKGGGAPLAGRRCAEGILWMRYPTAGQVEEKRVTSSKSADRSSAPRTPQSLPHLSS